MAKKKKSRKPVLVLADLSFVVFRKETLERQFNEKAEIFQRMMTHGGGIYNIHMLNTLRELQTLYLDIAAHHDAERSIKGQI